MGRSPCCEKVHTNKGAWSREEDQLLINYIKLHGEGSWRSLPKSAGLLRCGKSCRLRWINYLRPDLKRGNFTEEEDEVIIKLHSLLGNKWSLIAGRLPGRTDNEIKNYWNSHIKRKLLSQGVDPQTNRSTSVIPAMTDNKNYSHSDTKSTVEETNSSSGTTEEFHYPQLQENKKQQRQEKEKYTEINLDLKLGSSNHYYHDEEKMQKQEKLSNITSICFCNHIGFKRREEDPCNCTSMMRKTSSTPSTISDLIWSFRS